jgi:hypothetical protein
MMRIFAYVLGALALAFGVQPPAYADSVPFWGAKESVAAGTPIGQLKKGEYLWMADAVSSGPVVMVVSLTEQKAYVYRNGILIGATTVSTGRPGHLTPTGVFTVLQKQKEHRSTIYDGAPMPYMQRLTWGGIALHAGGLPGYPESHGCVHLPSEFAKELFAISPAGMTVVIADAASEPTWVTHPGYLAPVSPSGGKPTEADLLTSGEEEPRGSSSPAMSRWQRMLWCSQRGRARFPILTYPTRPNIIGSESACPDAWERRAAIPILRRLRGLKSPPISSKN